MTGMSRMTAMATVTERMKVMAMATTRVTTIATAGSTLKVECGSNF